MVDTVTRQEYGGRMTSPIPEFSNHQADFASLFEAKQVASQRLRDYAEPFARYVIGDQYFDNTSGFLAWDVVPVYRDSVLVALDFVKIVHDDRGPSTRRSSRVEF